jgi:hypothetical protein
MDLQCGTVNHPRPSRVLAGITATTAVATVAAALAMLLLAAPGVRPQPHEYELGSSYGSAVRLVCSAGSGRGSCAYLLATGAAAP